MDLNLFLPLKPISINEATSVMQNGNRVSSKKYNFFRKDVREIFKEYSVDLHGFAKQFDKYKHGFKVIYTHVIPNLFTKDGCINKKSLDVDNVVKSTQDLLACELAKYNAEIDDAQVLEETSKKIQGDSFGIHIYIKIVDIR